MGQQFFLIFALSILKNYYNKRPIFKYNYCSGFTLFRYVKRFKKQENADTATPSTSKTLQTILSCPSTSAASTAPLPDRSSPTSNSRTPSCLSVLPYSTQK